MQRSKKERVSLIVILDYGKQHPVQRFLSFFRRIVRVINWLRDKLRIWLDIPDWNYIKGIKIYAQDIDSRLRNEEAARMQSIHILTIYANEVEARVTKLDGGRLANLNPSKEVPEMYARVNPELVIKCPICVDGKLFGIDVFICDACKGSGFIKRV